MSALTECLRDVLDSTELADPRLIAEEMLTRIPDELKVETLQAALASWVRQELGRQRMLSPVSASGFSAKVAAIRADWQHRLRERVCVGEVWKELGDCTPADLRTMAADLRAMAAKLTGKADYYDELASHVPAEGTVRDLAADPIGAAA